MPRAKTASAGGRAMEKALAKKRQAKPPTKTPSHTMIDELYPELTERSKRGKKNREMGGDYELEVTNLLKPHFPRARRSIGQAREGNNAPDVTGTPYWIECGKSRSTTKSVLQQIHEKLEQGLRDSSTCPDINYRGRKVIVFTKHPKTGLHIASMVREELIGLLQTIVELDKECQELHGRIANALL